MPSAACASPQTQRIGRERALVGHAAFTLEVPGGDGILRGAERRTPIARPQKEQLRALTAEEESALQRVIRASSERVDRVRRARALLAVARGHPFAQAAQQAGLRSGTAVAGLVQRFNARGTALRVRESGVVTVVDPDTEGKRG